MENKVYRLTKDSELQHGLKFKVGQEFEIVNGVLYMGGYPVPKELQLIMITWITNNPNLFVDDTRNF